MRHPTPVNPHSRIDAARRAMLHEASMALLDNPGISCFNEEAAAIFNDNGCRVTRQADASVWNVRLPASVVDKAIQSAPPRVILGARNPANRLELDGRVPQIYFGTGSETNVFLETGIEQFIHASDPSRRIQHPVYHKSRGSIRRLCESARLCNALENVDFFIRNVNIQDESIDETNKDVNVFFASLMHTGKHVQAGIAHLDSLPSVIKMGELIAGSPRRFDEAPPISFIACVIKSPLQMVADTASKVIAIARRGVPLVISSSPQGGSTAPIQEEGMVAQINAEILTGITLAQCVNRGTPVLYGAVPVRARLDTLHDLYGAPEFIHYNTDCVELARSYQIPCYSTAGVGDAATPGIQASVEKMFSHCAIAQTGAAYIHYAFGLLDRTNTFSPVQAVIDNANVGVVKQIVRTPQFENEECDGAVDEIRKVMNSDTRLFARYIRKYMRRGLVSSPYPLAGEGDEDGVIARAAEKVEQIAGSPGEVLDRQIQEKIRDQIPGIQPLDFFTL
jgi:trimethylamine--corrinoid protein Co-methyltransferase